MTILTTTFTRHDAIGVREDLSDIISNIAPTETPFLSNAKKGKAKQTLFEWQTDTLAAAVSSNQAIEGDNVTSYTAVVPTVRMGNYVEIARKIGSITETVGVVDSAGGANDKGYIVAKLGKELKRDMETSLLANKAASAGSTGAARVTGGLKAWIKTNYNKDSGSSIPSYSSTPTGTWSAGSTRAFLETYVKDVLQQAYTSGANTSTIMVGAFNKQAFSAFSGVVELMSNVGKGAATIVGAADTYVSDFGRLSVVPNRFQPQGDALFIDWDMVQVNYLRPVKSVDLAKTGDAENFMLITEYGLQVNNEKGLGIVEGLTTS
jgi:hypothetical protein